MPYDSRPVAAAHPDNLAAVARLFGLDAPPPDACRVLELGSASGGHLLPLAFEYPKSQFVGIDLSPVQVNEGRRAAAALKLGNLRIEARDIAGYAVDEGSFDYIICHGVFS